MQDKTVRDNFSPVSHQVAIIHLHSTCWYKSVFYLLLIFFLTLFSFFCPPLASRSFTQSFWRHLSLSLLFSPTQPAHSFIPTLSVSHPYYQLHFNLRLPSLLSDPHVCMCVLFTRFIIEPTLLCCPPLVCLSAQLHHTQLTLQQYYSSFIKNLHNTYTYLSKYQNYNIRRKQTAVEIKQSIFMDRLIVWVDIPISNKVD